VERILSLWGFKNDYPPSKLISRKLRISVHFPTAAYDLEAAGCRSRRFGRKARSRCRRVRSGSDAPRSGLGPLRLAPTAEGVGGLIGDPADQLAGRNDVADQSDCLPSKNEIAG
jgi:hypothetical protein